jgi:hypothetical protein
MMQKSDCLLPLSREAALAARRSWLPPYGLPVPKSWSETCSNQPMSIESSSAVGEFISACPCPPAYLEAIVTMAAVAREVGVEALVTMTQMTASQMNIRNTTPSPQRRQHWLSKHMLAWSGLPVVTIRPTVCLEGFFLSVTGPSVRDRGSRARRLRRTVARCWNLVTGVLYVALDIIPDATPLVFHQIKP